MGEEGANIGISGLPENLKAFEDYLSQEFVFQSLFGKCLKTLSTLIDVCS